MKFLKNKFVWIVLALALASAALFADGNPTPTCNPHLPTCIPPR
jgi:hypothetical protein